MGDGEGEWNENGKVLERDGSDSYSYGMPGTCGSCAGVKNGSKN